MVKNIQYVRREMFCLEGYTCVERHYWYIILVPGMKISVVSSGVLNAKQGTAASGGLLNRSFAIKFPWIETIYKFEKRFLFRRGLPLFCSHKGGSPKLIHGIKFKTMDFDLIKQISEGAYLISNLNVATKWLLGAALFLLGLSYVAWHYDKKMLLRYPGLFFSTVGLFLVLGILSIYNVADDISKKGERSHSRINQINEKAD